MMFYAKNCFSFPSQDCELTLNACSGFLVDRPEQALTYISNISLVIGFIDRERSQLKFLKHSLFYGVHWPTMQRLINILKDTPNSKGPNKLKFLLQEQCPSKRALAKQLENEGDFDFLQFSKLALTKRGSLKNLNELQIDLVEGSSSRVSEVVVRRIASIVLDRRSTYGFDVSNSKVHVGSKEMSRTRFIWSSSKTG